MKINNNNFIIYKAQNTITGECYIGATTRSIEERKEDHLYKASTGNGHKFHYAITTSGADNFTWEQLDTASNPNELAEKETKYIYDFKAQEEGYNGDCGGGIKKTIYQYDMDSGILLNTFDDLTTAAVSVGSKPKSISNTCLGYNKSCMGFYWSYSSDFATSSKIDERIKAVVQKSLEGEIIENFKSASEASILTGISKTCITRCCRGEREQSGGFIWKYI